MYSCVVQRGDVYCRPRMHTTNVQDVREICMHNALCTKTCVRRRDASQDQRTHSERVKAQRSRNFCNMMCEGQSTQYKTKFHRRCPFTLLQEQCQLPSLGEFPELRSLDRDTVCLAILPSGILLFLICTRLISAAGSAYRDDTPKKQ